MAWRVLITTNPVFPYSHAFHLFRTFILLRIIRYLVIILNLYSLPVLFLTIHNWPPFFIYFFRTFEHNNMTRIILSEHRSQWHNLISFRLITSAQVITINGDIFYDVHNGIYTSSKWVWHFPRQNVSRTIGTRLETGVEWTYIRPKILVRTFYQERSDLKSNG